MSLSDYFLNFALTIIAIVISYFIGVFVKTYVGDWCIAVGLFTLFMLLWIIAGVRGWSFKNGYKSGMKISGKFFDCALIVIAFSVSGFIAGFAGDLWGIVWGFISFAIAFCLLMGIFAKWRGWELP
jgi:hypothetical protein